MDHGPTITTDRLLLRAWEESDAEELFALASDPQVGPSAGWLPHEDVDESAQAIASSLSDLFTYAVCLRQTSEIVGCASLLFAQAADLVLADDEAELGLWVGRPYWGQGIATEMGRGLLAYGFDELYLGGVWSLQLDGNTASNCVGRKLGFAYHHTEHDKLCPLLGERKTVHFWYLTADRFYAM